MAKYIVKEIRMIYLKFSTYWIWNMGNNLSLTACPMVLLFQTKALMLVPDTSFIFVFDPAALPAQIAETPQLGSVYEKLYKKSLPVNLSQKAQPWVWTEINKMEKHDDEADKHGSESETSTATDCAQIVEITVHRVGSSASRTTRSKGMNWRVITQSRLACELANRHPFSKACLQHSQTVIQPCMWFLHDGTG